MKALPLIAVVMLLCGCGPGAPQRLSFDSPYGLWSTERGQTVEVRRNGVYRYCDRGRCQSGKATRVDAKVVRLEGFFEMKAAEHLRQMFNLDVERRVMRDVYQAAGARPADDSFEMGNAEMADDYRLHLCQGRPCRIVGEKGYDVVRFVKLKDY